MRIQVLIRLVIAVTLAIPGFLPLYGPETAAVPVTGSGPDRNVKATIPHLPPLEEFVAAVVNGQPGAVTGVYVPGVLALRVSEQPDNEPTYVTPRPGYATQFGVATRYGTTGLLAHNYLSGALFFNLAVGQDVQLVYGDSTVRRYRISGTRRFQALSPRDPYSAFVDLDYGGSLLSSTHLFREMYTAGDRVVFQTCIRAYGESSWGRLFVIATPEGEVKDSVRPARPRWRRGVAATRGSQSCRDRADC